MCGFAAMYAYGQNAPPVDRTELLAIRDAMLPRGPDSAGLWLSGDGRAGLAHRRLAIIDLSPLGHQPMEDSSGTLHIAFNGEIYNHRELRAGLEARGYRFRGGSDTETLLYLYAEHGRRMVEMLRGMFAFALWDQRGRGMLLARDPFGIKPLYLHDDGRCLRAASQVKALLAGEVDAPADPAGHAGFFLWGHVPEPHTLYRGIRALPPGCSLWVDARGHSSLREHVSLVDELRAAEPRDLGQRRQEWIGAAVTDSVRHHLIADVPVGVFLSAGLDSTTLAHIAAAEVKPSPLRTITLAFEEFRGTDRDEAPLAELVARGCQADHQTVWVRQGDFAGGVQRILHAMDQPTVDGVNSYFVSQAAASCGLKVTLSGLGGDEMFGGYTGFHEIPRLVRMAAPFSWQPLGRFVRAVSAGAAGRMMSPKYAGLLEYGGSYAGAYLLRRGLFMPWELPGLMDPEMARHGWRELEPMLRLEETVAGLNTPHEKVCALETHFYMRNQLLRDSDWAGMAHSLEVRVPLVDLELFRRLAPLIRSQRPPSKLEMAASPARPLPPEILNRRKTGFGIPVHRWLGAECPDGSLRGWARRVYREFAGAAAPQLGTRTAA